MPGTGLGRALFLATTVALCGLVLGSASLEPSTRHEEVLRAAAGLFSPGPGDAECLSESALVRPGLELSPEERDLLLYLCIPPAALVPSNDAQPPVSRRGIPEGVNCTEVKWCDGQDQCTIVCARGSVQIPNWQVAATRAQLDAQRDVPLCRAAFLGTHNSAITLADGYGNLDEYWARYFKYIKWLLPSGGGGRTLRTNDHWLSLTDQLRLGVRVLELDTHWVEGELRIAHCGGLHVPQLNAIVKALNLVAKLLGKRIRWDTETLGCSPSLSSIPVTEQRTLRDALGEIGEWMRGPDAGDDVVVIFFDDQADLAAWGVVARMLDELRRAFPDGMIYTPADHAAWVAEQEVKQAQEQVSPGATASRTNNPSAKTLLPLSTTWPSPGQLAAMGKRVILLSGTDYGPAMSPLIFSKETGDVCGWHEPAIRDVVGAPVCDVRRNGIAAAEVTTGAAGAVDGQNSILTSTNRRTDAVAARNTSTTTLLPIEASSGDTGLWDGTWTRVISCELVYGPFNCEFQLGRGNDPWFDATLLASVAPCGLNVPSPDLLTPARAAGMLWAWAPRNPPPAPPPPPIQGLPGWWGAVLRFLYDVLGLARVFAEYSRTDCAAVRAADGRWVAVSCAQDMHVACRRGVGRGDVAMTGDAGGTTRRWDWARAASMRGSRALDPGAGGRVHPQPGAPDDDDAEWPMSWRERRRGLLDALTTRTRSGPFGWSLFSSRGDGDSAQQQQAARLNDELAVADEAAALDPSASNPDMAGTTTSALMPWYVAGSWLVIPGARDQCPPGSRPDVPRHAVDNARLAAAVAAAGQELAWLPLQATGDNGFDLHNLPAW